MNKLHSMCINLEADIRHEITDNIAYLEIMMSYNALHMPTPIHNAMRRKIQLFVNEQG